MADNSGNGHQPRNRRRADNPTRTDKAVKGCLTQTLWIGFFTLVAATMVNNKKARNV